MFNRKTLLLASVFSLLALGAKADTTCVKQDCAALGYTKTAAQCNGSDNIIKCPFDTSKVACGDNIRTPIVDWLFSYLSNDIGLDYDSLSLSTSLNDVCGGWADCASYLCKSVINGNYNLVCTDSVGYSDIAKAKTIFDLVSWIENQYMYGQKTDPCPGSVTVNPSLETCTSYCSADSSICMAKKTITCDEAITKAGGTKLASGTYTTLANATYYLTKDVSFTKSVSSMTNVYFREAKDLPPCANDSSVTQSPKLTFSQVYNVNGTVSFYVPTDIKYMSVYPNASPTIEVARDLRIAQIQKEASSIYHNSLDFMLSEYVASSGEPIQYSVVVGLMCKGSSSSYGSSDTECQTNFYADYTDVCEVKYCDETDGNGVNVIDCSGGGESANCTRTYNCSF